MNATAKVHNPDDWEVSITLTMKVSELRELRKQNAENEKASSWPLAELTRTLREVGEQIDRVYASEVSDVTHCPECGIDFVIKGRKAEIAG